MPPVCWCTATLGWVLLIGLALLVLVPVGLLVEQYRRDRR